MRCRCLPTWCRLSVRLDDGEGLGDYGEMTPKKAKPAAGARAGDVKGLPVKRGKSARGGSKRAQHGKKGVKAKGRGQRAESQKPKAKRKVKSKDRAGKSARITLEAKPVKVMPWEAAQALPDGQQERFCQLMALGAYSNYSCYLQAYPNSSAEAARSSSSDLLTNPNIRARIDALRAEALKAVKITLEDQLRWYKTVRDTPVGYVDEESPLAQEVQKEIEGTEETGPILKVKIKTPSKMDAARQIDKLMGYDRDKDDPMAKAVDTMAEMVRMIREGKKA